MKVVAIHKVSASVVQWNEVTSITADDSFITVVGIYATQTTPTTQVLERNLWLVRIIES